jgi:hypothetical protein
VRIIMATVQQPLLEAGAPVDPPTTVATAALAVRNPFAGRGRLDDLTELEVGGLLMAEYCRRCDEAGLEGYLETIRSADPSKRAQERLYERHGFAVAEVVPMTNDWSMVSMRRPAATTPGG